MHKTSDKRLDTLLERARECAKRWPHWRYAIAWPKDGWQALPKVGQNAVRRLDSASWERVLGVNATGYPRWTLSKCVCEIGGEVVDCAGYDDDTCPRMESHLQDILYTWENVAAEAATCNGLQPTGTIGTIQARLAAGWLGHLFDCYGLPPDEVIARDGGVWLIRRLSWPVFQATLSALELLANPPATPERSAAGADAAHPALAVATEAIGKNPKRSTSPGGATKKLISALTKHHKFANGGCLNLEPIGNNELARLADVDKSTASEFFTAKFQGHDKYKWLCRNDAAGLVAALKLLNGEFAPHLLYGSKPDERDRDAP